MNHGPSLAQLGFFCRLAEPRKLRFACVCRQLPGAPCSAAEQLRRPGALSVLTLFACFRGLVQHARLEGHCGAQKRKGHYIGPLGREVKVDMSVNNLPRPGLEKHDFDAVDTGFR